jgi:hypothetical protein
MAAVPASGRTQELAQLLADAEAWNAWAVRMNAKAIASGLVTAEEIERSRQASQAALAALTARWARP